ncbi:hypothetical protein SteCoe_37689 [Stentor coeruleus]|uniref:non-specific serine/threonine protein kinase n=1 Tax=Stentor coeruleus TaxID=5963 RepID=A0A1R2AMI8_9CILI|nr:hypothetical protein SteCoe_37689 [Stentor coeruleus]
MISEKKYFYKIRHLLISNSRDSEMDTKLDGLHKKDLNESNILSLNETTRFSTIASLSLVDFSFNTNMNTSPDDYFLTSLLVKQNYIYQNQINLRCSSESKTTSFIDDIKVDHVLIENTLDFRSVYANMALNHSHIPRCLGILEENDKVFALVEHYNCCLEDILDGYKYKEKNVRKFLGIIKAVILLQNKGISHGNINLRAILINYKGKYALGGLDSLKKFYEQSTMNKDYHFCAPEQLIEKLVLPSTDVWALACVFYMIVTGKLPYDDIYNIDSCIEQVAFEGKKPREINDSVYLQFKDVFNASFQIEPRKRPSIDMLYTLIKTSIGPRNI